ncbi:MAG: formate dehydrogenase accessory protein FdhE [Deltaproteobacteria bacterium]|nr:formate dehydrogenase accessory protein FdhE [Deltaproteobacteria bacterium]MBW2049164.1 formate dehydrogenase accessory protein FdhE [Deltaproteobacteria bacterium]MBW2113063.1 formate dehydrogenase accessory protein FdhE [Deltaproteobacteria bacterium]MBW2353732.1 formate dehydrogenase accessory protein FdhE [Deltaproteobacteria bacterium]
MTKDLVEHIDRLIRQRPASEPALTPFRELALIMAEAKPGVEPVVLEKEVVRIKKNEGFPLFPREDLPLDLGAASALLKRFLEHLSSIDRNDRHGLKKALEKTEAADEWSMALFKAILSQDEKGLSLLAQDVDLDHKVLHFLGQTAMTPSIHALRDAVKASLDREAWDYGYCPLCGSQPDMAFFARTGRRYLHCGLCGEEWAFSRIRCPFCDNRDQESLGYFEAEGEEGFRVYFCRRCSRYIKTIDKKAFEEAAPMELENLATIHLDLLAGENNFR